MARRHIPHKTVEPQPWQGPDHVCTVDDWCPCGHFEDYLRPANPSGTRPRYSLNYYERFDDRNSAQVDR